MKGIEYLAIPYSHEDKFVLEYRVLVSDTIAAALVEEGRIIYAPISSWHRIATNYKIGLDWKTWARFDREFIKASKKLLVVTLPGWAKSSGVQAELKLAKKFRVPIEFVEPNKYIDHPMIPVITIGDLREEEKIKSSY